MSPAALSTSTMPERHAWIDVLRGLAVVGMLETHCFNVFLSAAYDTALWRNWLDFFNGLAAPTFLWIAGYLQAMSIRKAVTRGKPVMTVRRVQYLMLVAGLGVCLQLPWDLWQQGVFSIESWRRLCQLNILQCLAISLALVLVLGHCCRRYFDMAIAFTLLTVVALAPWAGSWQSGWMPLDMWLNRNGGSLFPLFPWLGFCAAGCLFSRWRPSWKIWAPAAMLFAIGGSEWPAGPFNPLHPAFFAERLGWVLGLATVCLLGVRLASAPTLQLFGRESLFVYVVHLILLHALPLPEGPLDRQFGGKMNVQQALYAFAAMLLICLALAWLNEQRKKQKRCKAQEVTMPDQASA